MVRRVGQVAAWSGVLLLVFYNLTDFPLPWFDEGAHLAVPKNLMRFGVATDYNREFPFAAAVSIGPVLPLSVAAAFRAFGVGLLQARVVNALFLLGAIVVFHQFVRQLGGRRLTWAATVLLVSSPATALIEYGRQSLGEVPALCFLLAGLSRWFHSWDRARQNGDGSHSPAQLVLVGLLFGLATVTKPQYLTAVVPTLILAGIANALYYGTLPHRVFIIPTFIAVAAPMLWLATLLTQAETGTLQSLQHTAGGVLFSPRQMQQSIRALVSAKAYLWALPPALFYGFTVVLPKRRDAQQWGVLVCLVAVNLAWYVCASIGWLRYAFLGLALSSILVARFFSDCTDGFDLAGLWGRGGAAARLVRAAMLGWFALIVAVSLAATLNAIVRPGFNAPEAMAAYLNERVPQNVLIETWEPEMAFLTDHQYHLPPEQLLSTAVAHIWFGGPSPADSYDFVQTDAPDYVLIGKFATWVQAYPMDLIEARYERIMQIGWYGLYQRK